MIPLLGLSQNTDTPNNSFDVYQGLINGDNCRKTQLPECQKVAADLNKIIQDQSKSIIDFVDQHDKDQLEMQDLNDDRESQAVKIEKLENRAKRFGVGLYVGYGFDLKPSVGVGVSYDVFRF